MLKLFKDKRLIYVSAIVSLLLQIISFVTTYQGANYYFKEIFVLSPLLFAIAIQSVVYFLENSIRGRKNFAKIASLVLALTCSSYFSYIGIYNTVNSPISYYQKEYTEYKNTLETDYENTIDSSKDKANNILSKSASRISASYTSLLSEKTDLKEIIKSLDDVTNTNTSAMSAPVQSDYSSYEDYAQAYNNYISSSSNSSVTEINKKTKSILKKYGYSDRLEVVNKLSETNGELKTLKQAVNKLARSCGISASGNVSSQTQRIQSKLMAQVNNGNTTDTVTNNISKFISLANQYSSSKSKLNAKSIISCLKLTESTNNTNSGSNNNTVSLMADFKDVNTETANSCKSELTEELNNAVAELNRVNNLLGNNKTYDIAHYSLEDIYVLPILSLVHADTRGIALSCLAIAVLTDALSLLFAMMFCQPYNLLKLHRPKKILNDDTLFEQNIASTLSLSMRSDDKITMPTGTTMDEANLHHLADFINVFETVDNTYANGYVLQAQLQSLTSYQSLVALLCQLGLAKIIPQEKYVEKTGADNVKSDIVLLRTNFLLWCNSHWTATDAELAKELN